MLLGQDTLHCHKRSSWTQEQSVCPFGWPLGQSVVSLTLWVFSHSWPLRVLFSKFLGVPESQSGQLLQTFQPLCRKGHLWSLPDASLALLPEPVSAALDGRASGRWTWLQGQPCGKRTGGPPTAAALELSSSASDALKRGAHSAGRCSFLSST